MAPKSNRQFRLCINQRPLKALKRNYYYTKWGHTSRFKQGSYIFRCWHVIIDEKSIFPTTFKRLWRDTDGWDAIWDINCSWKLLQRRIKDLLEGLDGIKPFYFDILVYGCRDNDKEAHDDHDRMLEACFRDVLRETLNWIRKKLNWK